jgi:hypothetical protein
MRPPRLTVALLAGLFACNSAGTQLVTDAGAVADASVDVGIDAAAYDDGSRGAQDAGGDDSSALPPCTDLSFKASAASDDCVYAGRCPFDCSGGTASAYLCSPGPDASVPTFPSAFLVPVDPIDVVALLDAAYPWDAAAYQSCAALTCTRWATADHVDGGSAWPGDPCADGGAANQAWACPPSPGVVPAVGGCFAAGDMQAIGGPGTGIASDAVWCCPGPDSGP